jgi:hypothetical protein
MSASLTVSGGWNGQNGLITVPSSTVWGGATTAGSINYVLQQYLNTLNTSITGGSVGFENNDVGGGSDFSVPGTVTGAGGYGLYEITNTDNNGNVNGSTLNGSYTVPGDAAEFIAQAPGNYSVTGNTAADLVFLGAGATTVDYYVTNPDAGSIYAAGNDSITLFSTAVPNKIPSYNVGVPNAETIYGAGNDSINLYGQGQDVVSLYGTGTDVLQIQDAQATVYASGGATANIYWANWVSGGTLDFINNSTVAAFIQIPVFKVHETVNGTATSYEAAATNHVTAYGGVGGGFLIGGGGGNNLLVGGSGMVTLMGGGNGDSLYAAGNGAGANGSGNVFFAGSGAETMMASYTTGGNMFQAGLNYPGLGEPAANGVISTDGSGVQGILLGNSDGETIYGSTVSTATNDYYIVGDSTAGGGIFDIFNFADHSTIELQNSNLTGAGDASVVGIKADLFQAGVTDVGLSDGTLIKLQGVTTSLVATSVNGGVTVIYYK